MKKILLLAGLALVGCSTPQVPDYVEKVTCSSDSGILNAYSWYPRDGKVTVGRNGTLTLVDRYADITVVVEKPYILYERAD